MRKFATEGVGQKSGSCLTFLQASYPEPPVNRSQRRFRKKKCFEVGVIILEEIRKLNIPVQLGQ
jgi:hypothetical protein